MSAFVERLRTFHVERRIARAFTLTAQLLDHIRQARATRVEKRARLDTERKRRAAEIAKVRAKQAEWDRIAYLSLHTTLLNTTATTAPKPDRSWN